MNRYRLGLGAKDELSGSVEVKGPDDAKSYAVRWTRGDANAAPPDGP